VFVEKEKEEECYKHEYSIEKKKKNATNTSRV